MGWRVWRVRNRLLEQWHLEMVFEDQQQKRKERSQRRSGLRQEFFEKSWFPMLYQLLHGHFVL